MEAVKNIYPRLKVMLVLVPAVGAPASISVNIDSKHLIIDLLTPECPIEVQAQFVRRNLKPYELAVNAHAKSDHLYDHMNLERAQSRTLVGITDVVNSAVAGTTQVPIIVSYLEFN